MSAVDHQNYFKYFIKCLLIIQLSIKIFNIIFSYNRILANLIAANITI